MIYEIVSGMELLDHPRSNCKRRIMEKMRWISVNIDIFRFTFSTLTEFIAFLRPHIRIYFAL